MQMTSDYGQLKTYLWNIFEDEVLQVVCDAEVVGWIIPAATRAPQQEAVNKAKTTD
jgi:hypothetical protein